MPNFGTWGCLFSEPGVPNFGTWDPVDPADPVDPVIIDPVEEEEEEGSHVFGEWFSCTPPLPPSFLSAAENGEGGAFVCH